MTRTKRKPALFLDRDGVINHDSDEYIRSWSDFSFRPRTLEALSIMARWDIYLFIVTNQSGIARGFYTIEALESVHARMLEAIHRVSGRIDRIYYCPHHPDDGCHCRKPRPGMFEQASRDFSLDRSRLFMAGDKASDIRAGKLSGCFTILVEGPCAQAELISLKSEGFEPDATATDMMAVLSIVEKLLHG